MKEDMMVVGMTAIDEETMKLELVPLITTKKKVNILKAAMNGNASHVMKAIQGEQQHRTILYRPRTWCAEKHILPFSGMTLELDTGKRHKEKTGTQ